MVVTLHFRRSIRFLKKNYIYFDTATFFNQNKIDKSFYIYHYICLHEDAYIGLLIQMYTLKMLRVYHSNVYP